MTHNPYRPPHGQAIDIIIRPTKVRYHVLWLLTLAAALSYLVRNAVSVAESTIRQQLELTLTESAWFMGAFFWSYALFQVPSGWMSQQYGTRLVMTIFAISWSVATVLLCAAPGLWLLVIAQLLMGIAQAGVFPAACNSIAKWMPLARRSISCAVLGTGMQFGAILASLITGYLLAPVGWRGLFLLYALPGFAWAMWFWLAFRDTPQEDPHVNQAECELISQGTDQSPVSPDNAGPGATPWLAMIANRTLWFLCGQQMARASGYMFFASWFPTFLQKTRDVSINQSGMMQALVFTGTLVGSLCGGLVTDWIFRRTSNLRLSRSVVGAGALASCGVLILLSYFVQNAALAVLLMAIGSVCAAIAGPCAFSATIDVGGRHVPQVFGTMNMAGNLAAAVCPLIVAALFNWTANWNLALVMFAVVYLLGAVCWLFIDPRCKIEHSVSR